MCLEEVGFLWTHNCDARNIEKLFCGHEKVNKKTIAGKASFTFWPIPGQIASHSAISGQALHVKKLVHAYSSVSGHTPMGTRLVSVPTRTKIR